MTPSPLMRFALSLLTAGLAAGVCRAAREVSSPDERGNTPLHVAALRHDADAVDRLLADGADPSALNQAGATPLHYAMDSKRIVVALLQHGAKPDVVSKAGVTPLLGAAGTADSFEVIRLLLDAGANVNPKAPIRPGPHSGAGPLARAIAVGEHRTVALLLERGADVNPPLGHSPLCAAAFNGDLATTRLLLERGADVNASFAFAGTALNFALHAGHPDVAELLIEHGANLTLPSPTGHAMTPMVWSAYNDRGDDRIARLLVQRGVDVNTANDQGATALSYALKRGPDTPLVRFLREAGAREPVATPRAKPLPRRELPAASAAREALLRDAAQRAVELLQVNSTAFLENGFVRNQARCTSCHQQSLPAVAFGLARERGLRVDEFELGRQLHAQNVQRQPQAEFARQLVEPTPAADVTLGFEADGLHALGYVADDITDAMSHYLLGVQERDGSWSARVRRPPMEDGPILGTAWSARALQLYPPSGRQRDVARALERARHWLARQTPASLNEQVFQLLGLAWANESASHLEPFVARLLAAQRDDGGWAQLPAWPADSWATGSALVALQRAGLATGHAAYQRGLDFLLRTQFDDGSWWVRSRTWPFQPHFDGQFPHGKDQWISAAGTAWAAIAILLTLEPVRTASPPPAQTLAAQFARESATRARSAASARETNGDSAFSFSRDIHPLFERSCAGCHVGEKVRGGLSLASRESVLKGGQSGEPAIVPGRSEASPLLRYVSDRVEDLEMPPLDRREKYPPLTASEVTLLRSWIDAGAP